MNGSHIIYTSCSLGEEFKVQNCSETFNENFSGIPNVLWTPYLLVFPFHGVRKRKNSLMVQCNNFGKDAGE